MSCLVEGREDVIVAVVEEEGVVAVTGGGGESGKEPSVDLGGTEE